MNGGDIQLENGNYGRIHNAILDALGSAPLNGSEFRCLLVLLRKTYGWNKKEDKISLTQWSKATGMPRNLVIRTLRQLVEKRIVYRIDNGNNRTATWGFNKYTERWLLTSDETVTTETSDQVVTSSDQGSDQMVTTSSDQVVTKTSYQVVTHKRQERQIKNKGGAPHLKTPKRERRAQERIQLADDAGLTPRQLRENTDMVLGITALKKLVDAGDDRKLRDAQEVAVLLAKLGYGTPDALLELHDRWRSQNGWRANPIPSLHNLKEFASQDQSLQTQQPERPKEVAYITDPVTGERKEVLV